MYSQAWPESKRAANHVCSCKAHVLSLLGTHSVPIALSLLLILIDIPKLVEI